MPRVSSQMCAFIISCFVFVFGLFTRSASLTPIIAGNKLIDIWVNMSPCLTNDSPTMKHDAKEFKYKVIFCSDDDSFESVLLLHVV